MTRLEKIVLEQLKKGQFGERSADSTLSSKLNNKFKYGIISFYFVDTHGRGNKYDAFTADQVIERIPKSIKYITYSNGEYVFVIDDQNPISGKKETLWNVYIIDKKKTFPNISDQVFAENKSGQFNQSFIITFKQYDELLKKQAELVATTTKEKAAADAEKKKPAIEKTKVVVQNVVKGTETIDPNNLGKGTDDADAFQELLYQVGLKLIPGYTSFKKFASYRTKGPDGGWDGEIGAATLNVLDKLSLKDKYKSGDIAGVIKDLRASLLTTESTNYFKGTGMNIKLKDLLREQIIIKPDDEVTGGGTTNTTNTTNTKKKTSSTNFTQATFPSKYNGSGTITYNNGDKFTGSWVNGLKSGKGKFTKSANGTTIDGEWKAGKKNGIITFTFKDGKTTQQTWKDGIHQQTNEKYWDIAVAWVKAEYNFWEGRGSGPKGQARPKTHKEMFDQFNSTGFGNIIGDDDEAGAKSAYLTNRKIALKWLKQQLAGSENQFGVSYYKQIANWIYKIADQIDDYFQNDNTITLTNDALGDTITKTVQAEIDVNW